MASGGSVGDAYDSALAETTTGLYKHECTRADSPPPIEYETDYDAPTGDGQPAARPSPSVH